MFKCPFVSVKALEDAFYRLLSFTDSCQYWCKEWRTVAQTMSCCLTAPAPTLSLNITHPTILNIECEAERGNIADIGTGHCWPGAGVSHYALLPLCCFMKILPPKLYCQQWEMKALSLYLHIMRMRLLCTDLCLGLVLVFWANAQGNLWNKLTRNIPTQQ